MRLDAVLAVLRQADLDALIVVNAGQHVLPLGLSGHHVFAAGRGPRL